MDGSLIFDNEKYISAKLAAKEFDYASDYIGQLCRAKKVKARLVGRSWYVLESDLIKHKKSINDLPRKVSRSTNKTDKKTIKESNYEALEQPILKPVSVSEILYIEDSKELFPNLVRKFDTESLKYLSLKSADNAIKTEKSRSAVEKFVISFSLVSIMLVVLSGLFFGRERVKNLSFSGLLGNVKDEVAFLYYPYEKSLNFYSDKLTNRIQKINSDKYNLAALSFSGVESVTNWAVNLGRKIIKPWLEDKPVLVEVKKDENNEGGKVVVINQSVPSTVEAKTIIVPASDRAYVDQKISELKNYFLLSPLAPNVNRYYISRQNDVIVGRAGSSSSGSSSSSSSGASSLSDLSDITLTSSSYGDLLMYNGSKWVNIATSSLGINSSSTFAWPFTSQTWGVSTSTTVGLLSGFFSAASSTISNDLFLPSLSQGSLYVGSGGLLSTVATTTVSCSGSASCTSFITFGSSPVVITASGGGTGGGSWATTTSLVSGQYVNYSLNNTDIIAIGGTATTSAKYWFDPNTNRALIGNSATASTTISGNLFLSGVAVNSLLSTNSGGSVVATSAPTFGSFNATSTVSTSTISSGGFTVGGSKFMVQQNSGYVSIGNANPSYVLDIHVTNPTANQPLFRIGSSNNNTQMYISDQSRLYVEAGAELGNIQVGSQTSSDIITWNQDNASKIDFGSSRVNIASASNLLLSPTAYIGVSTTTPKYLLTIASSTVPQLSLSASAGIAQWTFRNAGGSLYLSTTTVDGTATTSISALEISGTGFGTTTIRGLNIVGQATSTSNVGYNITSGCYAIGGTCVSGGSATTPGGTGTELQYRNGSSFGAVSGSALVTSGTGMFLGLGTTTPAYLLNLASSTAPQLALSDGSLTSPHWTFRNSGGNLYISTSSPTTFATSTLNALILDTSGSLGVATNTPFGMLSVENVSSRPSFVVSDQANDPSPFLIDASGNVGVGTATPSGKVHILGAGSYSDGLTLQYTGASTPWNITQGLDFGLYVGYGTTQALTLASNGNMGVGTDYSSPPLAKFQIFATPAQKGSYSASNWNGSGSQLPALISTVNTNGGTTPSTAEPALVLARNGVFNQAYDNYAEFKLSRYENSGLNARTRLDIALTHGAGDGAGTNVMSILSGGMVGIGTTTPKWRLNIASTTEPQLALQGNITDNVWTFRSIGNQFYIATASPTTYATTSISALEISGIGFGTTTLRGLNISGQATSTANVGFNITSGCYAIGGTCVSGGSSSGGSDPFSHFNGVNSATTTSVAIGTTTAESYQLTISTTTAPQLSLSASVGNPQWTFRNAGGNLYLSTTTVAGTATSTLSALTILNSGFVGIRKDVPTTELYVNGASTFDSTAVAITTAVTAKAFRSGNVMVVGNFENTAATANSYAVLQVKENVGGIAGWIQTSYQNPGDGNGTQGHMTLMLSGASNPTLDLNLQGESVSIGTYKHKNKLDVPGSIGVGSGYGGLVAAPTNGAIIQGQVGIGTSTVSSVNNYQLTISSSTASQLSLSADAGIAQWAMRNAGGSLYLSTTTVDGTATTSISALEISGTGFGTTTVRGLNISGSATSTSNVGFNITSGCYAIGGTCVSGGSSGLTSYDAFIHPFVGYSATTSSFAVGTSTMSGMYGLVSASSTAPQLSLSAGAGNPQWAFRNAGGNFYLSTSTVAGTATSSLSVFTILNTGYVGISTSSPTATLSIQSTVSTNDIFRISSTTGIALLSINKYGALVQNLSSTSAIQIQDGSSNPVFTVDTTQTTGAGIDITAASGQTSNLLNIFQSNGTTNYLAVGSSGNFGIGTGTPSHMFTIATSSTTKSPVFDIYSNNAGATSTIGFFVSTTTGSAAGVGLGLPSALANYILVGNGKVQAGMAIVNGGLCVDNDGWCTASTTGRISAVETTTGGTDLAEIYNSNERLEAGDVVAITTPLNFIKIADLSGDKNKTLGVIATDPGIILGLKPGEEQGGNQYPVALAGRVPVKVSTENGNIEAGDYLTLSSVSGVAMKATESGNVVGRALEAYSQSGVGKITMFVSNTYYAGEPSIIVMNNNSSTTIYMTSTSSPSQNATTTETATTTATTTSGLSTTEGLGQIIVRFLEEIGLKIMDGIAYVKTLFVEKLIVGTPEKPGGITIYDEVTGEPYCLKVVNGAMASVAGECADAKTQESQQPSTPSNTPTETPISTATSTAEQIISPESSNSATSTTEGIATSTIELPPESVPSPVDTISSPEPGVSAEPVVTDGGTIAPTESN